MNAFSSNLIDVWRFNSAIFVVAGQITIAEFVGHDQDDICLVNF